MALTPSKSTQYIAQTEGRPNAKSSDVASKLRYSFGKLTFTEAGQGTAQMVKLPAGKIRVISDLSRIVCPLGTTTADLHVGYAAHTKLNGTAVVAAPAAFADDLDVGAAAIDAVFSLPAVGGFLDLESREGIDIEIMIDTANGPAAGDAVVMVAFQYGN